jgi:DNA-binding response OmpR family regulator
MTRLLVVAPNRSFRNSLRFALEAEGYDITAAATLRDVDQPASSFDCVVVDHHAIDGVARDDRRLLAAFPPLVLLANSLAHPLAGLSFRTLTKPTLGPALSDAVRAAIAARDAT